MILRNIREVQGQMQELGINVLLCYHVRIHSYMYSITYFVISLMGPLV